MQTIGDSAACLLAVLVLGAVGCTSARQGWGRGPYHVVEEATDIQVRRSPQVLDPHSGALTIAWIGVRIPPDADEMTACELSLFVDRDQDRRPDPSEVFAVRSSSMRTRKLMFDALRIAPEHLGPFTRAWIEVRTADETHTEHWALKPDN